MRALALMFAVALVGLALHASPSHAQGSGYDPTPGTGARAWSDPETAPAIEPGSFVPRLDVQLWRIARSPVVERFVTRRVHAAGVRDAGRAIAPPRRRSIS